VEGISSYSPYRAVSLGAVRGYDPTPVTNVDLTSKMDIEKAIAVLHKEGKLSDMEVLMLEYVKMDGRLSRRDISALLYDEQDIWINQRTISRKLDSAYQKIQKYLGFDYSDERVFKMIARKMNRPEPYILSDLEMEEIQQHWERI
jgi:DNA mismatch repair ATPase MutS